MHCLNCVLKQRITCSDGLCVKSCILTDMSGATCRFLFLLDPSESVDDELLDSEAWHNRSCSAVPQGGGARRGQVGVNLRTKRS